VMEEAEDALEFRQHLREWWRDQAPSQEKQQRLKEISEAIEHVRSRLTRLRAKTPLDESGKGWPKRWRQISLSEKLSEIKKVEPRIPIELLDYSLRCLGNAAAHKRPEMLRDFFVKDGPQSVRFRSRSRLRMDYGSSRILVLGPFVSLLAAAWRLTDAYYLPDKFRRRRQRILERWRSERIFVRS
jgi:hypothetical protein